MYDTPYVSGGKESHSLKVRSHGVPWPCSLPSTSAFNGQGPKDVLEADQHQPAQPPKSHVFTRSQIGGRLWSTGSTLRLVSPDACPGTALHAPPLQPKQTDISTSRQTDQCQHQEVRERATLLHAKEIKTHNLQKNASNPRQSSLTGPPQVNQICGFTAASRAAKMDADPFRVIHIAWAFDPIRSDPTCPVLSCHRPDRGVCLLSLGQEGGVGFHTKTQTTSRAGCAPSTMLSDEMMRCYLMSKPSARRHSLCASMNLAHSSSPFMITQSSLACGGVSNRIAGKISSSDGTGMLKKDA